MRKLPPLNAVRVFEAAARHVSFTGAARELGVTHGAVSKQVAQLEAWLGCALFSRAQAQLQLTAAGRTFVAVATPALDRLSVAASHLMEHAEASTLRVNAPPTFTMRWLIPRLSSFQRRRPDVEVKLTTSTAPVNFEQGGYDVAIRGARAPIQGLASEPFMTETIVPICHPDLLDGERLRCPQDLVRHTLLSYETEPVSWSDWLELAGQSELHPAQALRFEQMYFALQAAAEGLGVVLVPLFLVADDIITGRLCAPFGVRLAHKRQYFANSAPGERARPAVESFCHWLLREGQDTERSIGLLAQSMG